MFKKISLAIFVIFSAISSETMQSSSPKKINLTFALKADQNTEKKVTDEVAYCCEILQDIAKLQQTKTLSLEEIIAAIKVLFYLYNMNDAYQTMIQVVIDDQKPLKLPFSKDLLASIFQQISDEAGQQEGNGL